MMKEVGYQNQIVRSTERYLERIAGQRGVPVSDPEFFQRFQLRLTSTLGQSNAVMCACGFR